MTFTHAKCMIAQALTFTNCALVPSPSVLRGITQISLPWLSWFTSQKRGTNPSFCLQTGTQTSQINIPGPALTLWRGRGRRKSVLNSLLAGLIHRRRAARGSGQGSLRGGRFPSGLCQCPCPSSGGTELLWEPRDS